MTLEVCRVYCAETSWSLYLEMSNLTTSHRQRGARRNGSTEATDTSRIRMELEESNTGVELGKRSRETMESTHSIVSSIVADLTGEACSQMPKSSSLKRQCQRERTKAKNAPPNPGSLQEILLPEDYTMTRAGEDFLFHDSGPNAGHLRMLVFATESNIAMHAGRE